MCAVDRRVIWRRETSTSVSTSECAVFVVGSYLRLGGLMLRGVQQDKDTPEMVGAA